MNLFGRNKRRLSGEQRPPRIALPHIYLALQNEEGVVGVIVNVLGKFVSRFRHSPVESYPLCSHVRVKNAAGIHLSHMKRHAVGELQDADWRRLTEQRSNEQQRQQPRKTNHVVSLSSQEPHPSLARVVCQGGFMKAEGSRRESSWKDDKNSIHEAS